ncbi:DUF503 domain-containing protein [Hazenella coriacea]|uniref:DUF503 domain-containing protein n=1 Tax=Hazenella coriacea TaxID=1179467 RepID=UPI003C78EC00
MIGLLEVSGRVIGSSSLKDKRSVIKRGQTRIRNQFNLSVAEIGHQDDRQITELALVGVGSNRVIVEKELQQALKLLESLDGLEIYEAELSYL